MFPHGNIHTPPVAAGARDFNPRSVCPDGHPPYDQLGLDGSIIIFLHGHRDLMYCIRCWFLRCLNGSFPKKGNTKPCRFLEHDFWNSFHRLQHAGDCMYGCVLFSCQRPVHDGNENTR